MRIETLKYFITVADCGTMTLASKLLHISQQTISKEMKQLEEELNTKLFVRSKHGVTLTETGIYTYQQVEEILKRLAHLEHVFKFETDGEKTIVNIAAYVAFRSHLDAIKNIFVKNNFNCAVGEYYYSSEELLKQLQKGTYDIVLMQMEKDDFCKYEDSKGYRRFILLEEPLMVGISNKIEFPSMIPVKYLSNYAVHFFTYTLDEVPLYQQISNKYHIKFRSIYKSGNREHAAIVGGTAVFFSTKSIQDNEYDSLPIKFYPVDIPISIATVLYVKTDLLEKDMIQSLLNLFLNFFEKYK